MFHLIFSLSVRLSVIFLCLFESRILGCRWKCQGHCLNGSHVQEWPKICTVLAWESVPKQQGPVWCRFDRLILQQMVLTSSCWQRIECRFAEASRNRFLEPWQCFKGSRVQERPKSGTVSAWLALPVQETRTCWEFADNIKNQYNLFMRQQMVVTGSCGKGSVCRFSEASTWCGKAWRCIFDPCGTKWQSGKCTKWGYMDFLVDTCSRTNWDDCEVGATHQCAWLNYNICMTKTQFVMVQAWKNHDVSGSTPELTCVQSPNMVKSC